MPTIPDRRTKPGAYEKRRQEVLQKLAVLNGSVLVDDNYSLPTFNVHNIPFMRTSWVREFREKNPNKGWTTDDCYNEFDRLLSAGKIVVVKTIGGIGTKSVHVYEYREP